MIAKLSGIMDSAGQDYLILDVNGVGYQVFASGRTLSRVQKGEPVSLLIDTHVREDHIHLYGFMDKAEQEWFRLLTSVQGVGAKVGMAILGTCPVDRLGFAIAAGDAAFVRQADGVGPKLATRIVTELKDKAAKIDLGPSPPQTTGKATGKATGTVTKLTEEAPPANIENDAVSALVNLGYGRADAYSAVLQVRDKANDNLSEILKLALKELAS